MLRSHSMTTWLKTQVASIVTFAQSSDQDFERWSEGMTSLTSPVDAGSSGGRYWVARRITLSPARQYLVYSLTMAGA